MANDPSLSLFTAALGLAAPWKVTNIDFDETAKRIDFRVGYDRGTHFACPACAASDQPVQDRRQRTWQHLHFFEHRAFIHAEVPRVPTCRHIFRAPAEDAAPTKRCSPAMKRTCC